MLLETIRALIARFASYDGLAEQPHPPGTADESTNVGSTSNGGTGSCTPETNSRTTHEGQPAPVMLATTFFPNARDFVFNNPVMISQVINTCGMVLQLLGQKRIPGAEVDSSARDPPPKCHPDTRKSLRGRITKWLSNPNRDWRMLWVMGPMGVGKSAVAQTIAEETKKTGQLGAALFFSRTSHRDDPEGVVSTLAYQLAVKSSEYKRIIAQRLFDDPTILEKNRRAQFKELIIEPFQLLMTQHPQIVHTPLLIVLDGLDECRSKEAQCEFIELISDHARQVDEFPLLWMVCSRPEWHLKGLLSHPDFHIACRREEMVVDDVEAEEDVMVVLKKGFRDIYHKYRDHLEPGWPPATEFRQISTTASGHFAFASTILKYVGDPQPANPRAQLHTCIRFLGGPGMPGAINPLHALDLLYRQVLADVPEKTLETTMRILGQIVLYWNCSLTILNQANFLCIDQAAFYCSLQHLHSVLDIPSSADASRHELRFHHTSFKDFLLDPYRSGSFAINQGAVHYDIATSCLKWQGPPNGTTKGKNGVPSTNPMLAWVHPEVKEEKVLGHLRTYSMAVGWNACRFVHEKDLPNLVTQLEHFDFEVVLRCYNLGVDLSEFVPWVFKLAHRLDAKSLIRQVMPDNPAIRNGTRILAFEYFADILEDYLAGFGPHLNIPPPQNEGNVTLRFQLGKDDNALTLKLTAMPYRANSSYMGDQSDEISLSEGETVHVVDRTQRDRWYVRKLDGTEGFVPLECMVAPLPFKYRACALCSYTASGDRPNEISFSKGEIVGVIDDGEDWWKVEKSDGTTGVAPSKLFVLYVTSEYKARALYNHTVYPLYKYHLPFNKGEIVDVIEPDYNGNSCMWIVRKADGTVGPVPSHLFVLIET